MVYRLMSGSFIRISRTASPPIAVRGLYAMRYPRNSPCIVESSGALHLSWMELELVLWAAVILGFPLGAEGRKLGYNSA